ncbi:MAG: 4Fe-4S dicluster domain-containing protein [Deltaproteobacteria bacterium]|nr:4Fe-4S dicluster domain-containing protein [Deltaproteobacteria bacterium]
MSDCPSLSFVPELCSGCLRCMTTCATFHTGATGLSRSRLRISRHEGHALTDIHEEDDLVFGLESCRHCARPSCLEACPSGAIMKEREAGVVRISDEKCTRCGDCVRACAFGAMLQDPRDGRVVKCELCSGQPECVKSCPTGALRFGKGGGSPGAEETQGRPAGHLTGIPGGYAGRALLVDLTAHSSTVLPIDEFWREYDIDPRLWLGGDGFITKVLWKDFQGPVDPLGPENEIVIATGPWTATAAPQAGRAMLGCLSPETGGFGSGSFGWFFPAALKYAGFDVVILRGRSPRPVYVFIDDQDVSFRDASHLWGKETGPKVRSVREELGEAREGEIRVLSTSVAGENLVRYAPPCADGTSCPGRTGAGAVMGSKNLKALAVRGTGEVPLFDARGLLESSRRAVERFAREEPFLKLWTDWGASTALATTGAWALDGAMLARNRDAADVPHLRNVGCLNCHNPCYHWLQVKEGKRSGLRQLGGHMAFLTAALRNLGIEDFGEWIYFERLTQELGLDPASFSVAVAWAVECFERGFLTLEETDGVALRRGDPEQVALLAGRVARREGRLGDLLADGVAEARRRLGKDGAPEASCVKGKPSLLKDSNPQALIWAFGALTSPRGGDWLRLHNVWELAFAPEGRDRYPQFLGVDCAEVYRASIEVLDMPAELKARIFGDPPKVDLAWVRNTEGKALFSLWSENLVCLFNCLAACMFGSAAQYLMVGFGPTTYSELLNRITGWDTSAGELLEVGERVFTLQRLFNHRLLGWDGRSDAWSAREGYEPAKAGLFRGRTVPWNELLREYYELRGWSPDGLPTAERLDALGLLQHAEGLPGIGG